MMRQTALFFPTMLFALAGGGVDSTRVHDQYQSYLGLGIFFVFLLAIFFLAFYVSQYRNGKLKRPTNLNRTSPAQPSPLPGNRSKISEKLKLSIEKLQALEAEYAKAMIWGPEFGLKSSHPIPDSAPRQPKTLSDLGFSNSELAFARKDLLRYVTQVIDKSSLQLSEGQCLMFLRRYVKIEGNLIVLGEIAKSQKSDNKVVKYVHEIKKELEELKRHFSSLGHRGIKNEHSKY